MDEAQGPCGQGGHQVRPFTVSDHAQRSLEWRQARAGRLTASRAGDAIGFRKDGKGELAARRDYRIQLVTERLTGQPCDDDFTNADMERGIALEPDAIAAYEIATGHLVSAAGFLAHTTHMAGYSPDGIVNDFQGLIEVKCPRPANHLSYFDAGRVPPEHLDQCRHALWLTGAEWIDFVSYAPAFPESLRLFICRLERAHADIAGYEKAACQFLEEVELKTSALRGWSVMEASA